MKTEAELNAEAAAAARDREGTRLYTAPCPICNTNEHVHANPAYVGYLAYCDGCYDVDCVGDPPRYVSLRPIYHGNTEAEALREWNENMRDN